MQITYYLDMKTMNRLRNMAPKGVKLPPPTSLCDNNIRRNSLGSCRPALLHQAYAFCGRASLCLALAVLPLLAGCEKDLVRYEEIRQYHQESKTLQQVEADSVNRFTQKVDAFVAVHTDATDDPLYPEIRQNIEDALVKFVITVQDEWDKEDVSY